MPPRTSRTANPRNASKKVMAKAKVNAPAWTQQYQQRAPQRAAQTVAQAQANTANAPAWAAKYQRAAPRRAATTVAQAERNAINQLDPEIAATILSQRREMAQAATPQTAFYQAMNNPNRKWMLPYMQPAAGSLANQAHWESVNWATGALNSRKPTRPGTNTAALKPEYTYRLPGTQFLQPRTYAMQNYGNGYTEPVMPGTYNNAPTTGYGNGYGYGGGGYEYPSYGGYGGGGGVYADQTGYGANPQRGNVPRWWQTPTTWKF